MRGKVNTKKKLVKQSNAELLALVAEKLKGRDLFPQKTSEAKRLLQNAKISIS